MSRQIDIDLLLPKIIKFKTSCNDKKTFSANQVLWMLEQEFALQNGTTNDMQLSNNRNQCVEIMSDIVQSSIKVCDCQSELSEIKNGKISRVAGSTPP